MLYGPTNEEQITEIFRTSVKSIQTVAANFISHTGNLEMNYDQDLA